MSSLTITPIICFVACHGGPADHFASYADTLSKKGFQVQIYASGQALSKFQERKIEVKSFSVDSQHQDLLAEEIAAGCKLASVVFTDIGHPFDIPLQAELKKLNVINLAYYDNSEPFVPGGYSTTAAKVIESAKGVVFSNRTLINSKLYLSKEREKNNEIDLNNKTVSATGYYPVEKANVILARRESDQQKLRIQLFQQLGIEEKGQKILVYFGGNNEEYFKKAFPAFLSLAENVDREQFVILIQQHPGAKELQKEGQEISEKGKDKFPHLFISDLSSDDAQVLADAALYYQTSMGPQYALAEIPTIQIGHEVYPDILVRNGLASTVTNDQEFVCALQNLKIKTENPLVNNKEENRKKLFEALGLTQNWQNELEKIVKTHLTQKEER